MHDDELLDALGQSLRDETAGAAPQQFRIDALRAAAVAKAQADATGAPTPHSPTDPPSITSVARRGRRGWWVSAAAAALVFFVVGAVVGTQIAGDDSGPDGNVEYAGPINANGQSVGTLSVIETGIGRVIELDTHELPILPTGEYYEVWFVAADEPADSLNRISAGTFHPDPDGHSNVTFAAAVDPAKYPIVEITAEPGDGNPAPTGAVVLTATIGS